MKINYALISRVLIALLFVVAGFGKATHFSDTVAGFASMNVPMANIAVIIAILVELPVAILFAIGYKTKITGAVLAAFTAAATLIAHRDIGVQMQMIQALKNIAIIGGILAAIKCTCGCDSCKSCKAE
jgi:putative oxidoreductase